MEYVNDLEMPDVFELLEYWNDFPPAHLLLRMYVGYRGETRSEIEKIETKELDKHVSNRRSLDAAPAYLQIVAEGMRNRAGR